MGKIYYVMGKSAAGKDTVYQALLKSHPMLQPLVAYTTRPKREGEREGESYHFVSEGDLDRLKALGRVIEMRSYQTVEGIWQYATVDDGEIQLLEHSYLAIGTLESFEKIRDYFGRERVQAIYILLEDGLRLERALRREQQRSKPGYAEMCRRYLADEADFSPENLKKAGIHTFYSNEDLESCLLAIEGDLKEAVQ